jgi:glucose/arabinose dehydrogenase
MARTRRAATAAACIALVLAQAAAARAQVAAEPESWLAHLAFPTNLAFAPDGRLFFTEKETGRVRIVRDGRLLDRPFVELDVVGEAERGLLGIALDPDFGIDPWVYLYLSDARDGRNRLVRIRADGDRAAGAPQTLLDLLPSDTGYHNGGDLLFLSDGTLLVAVGETHDADRAQDPDDPGGKILRIARDGSVPNDDPVGPGNPAFTLGHRNSFGLCADVVRGTIWETENGPDVDDEVNRLVAGANYGWPEVTGVADDPRFTDPEAVFPDTVALTGCAVAGDALYVGAFNTGALYRFALTSDGQRLGEPTVAASLPAGITDVTTGPDGALYAATADAIWRLGGVSADESASPSTAPSPASETPSASLIPESAAPSTDAGDAGRSTPAWVPVAAALVLAVGLILRLVAGRRLRSADGRDHPDRPDAGGGSPDP